MTGTRAEEAPGWRCPRCGRQFTRRTKEHSCDLTPIAWHLDRTTPPVRAIYAALETQLDGLGEYQLLPLKTMVSLATVRNFGGITFGKAFLDLGVMLARPLDHPRIHQVQRLSARSFAHHIRLTAPEEVDGEIVAWLREAYDLSLEGRA